MAYDPEIAARVRKILAPEPTLAERNMFGGLAFLIRGHMAVAASSKGGLMVRADPATTAHLVETTSAEYVEMRGRLMHGWLHLDSTAIETNGKLTVWINRALSYTSTQPHNARRFLRT